MATLYVPQHFTVSGPTLNINLLQRTGTVRKLHHLTGRLSGFVKSRMQIKKKTERATVDRYLQ